MTDLIIVAVVAAIVGGALLYIRREKKRGAKCIGCPAAQNGCCGGSCGCANGQN